MLPRPGIFLSKLPFSMNKASKKLRWLLKQVVELLLELSEGKGGLVFEALDQGLEVE